MYLVRGFPQKERFMKKRRLSYFLLITLLIMTTALMSFALAACNKKQTEPAPQSGDEAGVYYYDAGSEEYTVVLGQSRRFTLAISNTTRAGGYTLTDNVLTLTSDNQDENQIAAILSDNVITLTLNDAEYRFLKKINYTVTFDSNEGSSVGSATVVNGKKVAKPQDPSKDGSIFVGWYADEQFKTPFSFNSQIVTADMTLYARWVAKQVGQVEFTVSFDAGNGDVDPADQSTVGDKLFNLPVVERNGYAFKGWWVSMNNDDVLSYEYTEGMSLDANTTLHAVWQANDLGTKLAAPLVNVDANSIKWNSVGAREYLLKVEAPDGNYIINESMGGTTVKAISFDELEAGDYKITVTAVANSGEENNAVTERLYKNKALARVSKFSVIAPSMMLFNAVDNAEKYLITVDCGDKNHKHVNFDNGTSTHFNFADCAMQNGGIKFSVTAVAEGYASSVGTFVYAPTLDAVTEFDFDEQNQKLVWNKIENATGYMVSVKCGNAAHSEEFVNIGAVNSISLKECAKCNGGIVIEVYPVSNSYISPKAAKFTFDKQNLATPSDIRISGTTVSWTAVAGATSYEVRIAGTTLTTDTNSIDIAGKVTLAEKADYTLTVVAKGDKDSLATDPVDARNLAMADTLKYENGVLSWKHVIGAAYYDVQVNDGAPFSVTDGLNFTNITFDKAGENTVQVRFVSETGSAFEWVRTQVFAHSVTFVSDGGSSVSQQFKAVGDKMTMPSPEKEGFDFLAWYNTPKGPQSNGAAYKDAVFNEAGDLVLYACYTPKKYTVTYHYGDGGNAADVNAEVFYQQDFNLTVPQANKATSAFGGWFSAPNGNGVRYTDDKGNSLAPWNRTENADVYAFWFDDVLTFTRTTNAGRPIYAVLQGSRISQVSEVTVPAMYNGVKVGMLAGNAFKDCSNLTTINIPNTLEIISAVDPFTGCSSLEAINVYEVEGNTAIRYWSEDGVLFDNGRLDQQPSDPSQIRAQISFMPLAKTGSYHIPEGIVEIPSLAFANCALTRVVIPSSVTAIGAEAFKNSLNLTTIVFDTGSTQALTIGDAAFKDCKALETITLPARLSSIGLQKFELLTAVDTPASQDVSLDTGVTNAFAGCKNLTNIYIASGNKAYKSVDGIIYSADGTTLYYALPSVKGDLQIPAGTLRIADGAFIGCDNITSVTIPNTVTSVGVCAFYDTDVEEVTFQGNGFNEVTIGKYAFRDCGYLTSVKFESGNRVAYICEGAFFGCDDSGFTSIELPAGLKSLGAQAFRDCDSLEEIIFSSTVSELTFGADAFYNCSSLSTLTLPSTVKTLPSVFSGCTSLTEVVVDEDNPYFTSEDGVLFDKNKTTILFYPARKSGYSYVLPESLTTIPDGIFKGNQNLETITIGKNVSYIGVGAFQDAEELEEIIFTEGDNGAATLEIGAYAFANSNYNSMRIELPSRTTKVGEYAFANQYLRSITLNEGLEEISDYMLYNAQYISAITIPASVTRIGKYAFYNCGYQDDTMDVTFAAESQLETIDDNAFNRAASYNYSDLAITLPSGLKHIGYQAFASSGFTEVTIPNTVKTIATKAFASSKIKTVTFEAGGTDDLILGAVNGEEGGYGNGVFYSTKLTSVELPARLTFLGAGTFESCSSLESVTFGAGSRLKHIGAEAFDGTKIQTITIPKSVANGNVVIDEKGTQEFRIGIGARAFYGASKLTEIIFEDGGTLPLSIGDEALYSVDMLETVNLPARTANYLNADGEEVLGVSYKTFGLSGQSSSSVLSAINVDAGCLAFCSVDGVLYTKDKSELLVCPVNKAGKVTVAASVTRIDNYAFAYSKIDEIEFVGGTADMVIGASAFWRNSGIQTVILSDNVVEIEANAFGYCESLTSITLSANLKNFDVSVLNGTNIQQINVSDNSGDFKSINGVMFSKDMKTLVSYPSTATATSYEIPSTVTAIADNAFRSNTYLTSVTLPAGLKSIGDSAFWGCSNLSNVTIPNTVESIGKDAFASCSSLGEFKFADGGSEGLVLGYGAFENSGITKVALPARLTAIANSAFYRCSALESVTFAVGSKLDSIGENVFYSCVSLKNIVLPGLNQIGSNAFAGCTGLETVKIGEGLRETGDGLFASCSSLKTAELPASLNKMGLNTFSGCTSLTSVAFAAGSQLEILREGTFNGCSSLERFTIPASVTAIEACPIDDYGWVHEHYAAFQGCTSLKSVVFEEGSKCKLIGAGAFMGCKQLEAISIPSTVSTLGDSAFAGCEAIEEIVIPATATVYGDNLFSGCISLSRVVLNDRATALSNGMFSGCTSLKNIDIPKSVTSFGDNLFSNTGLETFTVPSTITDLPRYFLSGCKSLTSVTLPQGLQTVGDYAFNGCIMLEAIVVPAGVTTMGVSVFAGCERLNSVSLPATLDTMGREAFSGCYSLEDIVLPNALRVIERYTFEDCESLKTVKLPSSVQSIDSSAFSGCYSLESFAMDAPNRDYAVDSGILYNGGKTAIVSIPAAMDGELVLPSTITEIAAYAFEGTGFTKITLPATMTEIGYGALAGCEYLEEVVILGNVTSIDSNAFYGCTSLERINIPDTVTQMGSSVFAYCTSLQSVTLPQNLTYIGSSFFSNCTNLQSVVIPNGVESIGYSTFYKCTSLTSIKLPNSLKSLSSDLFSGLTGLESFSMDDGGKGTYKVIDGVLYSWDTDAQSNVRLTMVSVPVAKKGTLALPTNLYSISSYAFKNCTGIENYTMEADGSKYKVINGALYSYALGENDVITSLVLESVPAAKSGVLTLPKEITGINSSLVLNDCTLLTGYAMEGYAGLNVSYKTVKNGSSYELFEVITPESGEPTETKISTGSFRVIDGVLYRIGIGYEYSGLFKADGTEYTLPADVEYTLYSFPAGRTGTFTIPNFVYGRNVEDNAFKNSKLDLLKFEGNRQYQATDDEGGILYIDGIKEGVDPATRRPYMIDHSVEAARYYASWLYTNTTIKGIVIDSGSLELNGNVFTNWTSDQTIYFVQSEEDAKAEYSDINFSSLNANVVFGYTEG